MTILVIVLSVAAVTVGASSERVIRQVNASPGCPPLSSIRADMNCFFADKPTNCNDPQRIRSVAHVECKPGFVPGSRVITCSEGGVWDAPPVTCRPDCGKRHTNESKFFIANNTDAFIGEFPWLVGLYDNMHDYHMCLGTLITPGLIVTAPGLIVTAAHCVWNDTGREVMRAEQLRVAAGKHRRKWNNLNPWAQKRKVVEIVIKGFQGRDFFYEADIALVRVQVPFEITNEVNVACVDWNHDLDHRQLVAGNEGLVAAWGSDESQSPSNTLHYVRLTYQPRGPCKQVLSRDPLNKFCVSLTELKTGLYRGDSGGGLVFLEPTSNRYYLRGVISIIFPENPQYFGVTDVGNYSNWLLDHLYYEYSQVNNENSDI